MIPTSRTQGTRNTNFLTLSPVTEQNPCVPREAATTYARAASVALAFILLFASSASAQGCSQCLDTTRATPPAVQSAYRHAIFLLAGTGTAAFVAGALLLRRDP